MSDCSHEGPWPASASDVAPAEQPPAKVKDPIAEIYREHCDFVWQVLQHFRVDPQHTADALQDVFVVIQRRYDAFEHRASLRTWIYAITRRVASRYHRSGQRKHRKLEALATDPTFISPEQNPDDTMALVQGRALLAEFLGRLDAKHRQVFELQSLVGMSSREVAEATGLRPSTVIGRQRAAKLAFQRFCDRVQAREHQVLSGRRRLPAAVRSACWVAVLTRLSLPASARASMAASTVTTLKAWWVPTGALRWVALATVVTGGGGMVALESKIQERTTQPTSEASIPMPQREDKTPQPTPAAGTRESTHQPSGEVSDRPSSPSPAVLTRPQPRRNATGAASTTRVPKPRSARTQSTSPQAPSPSKLSRELALLRSINQQNRQGNFHAALRLTDQYKHIYPEGKLTRESQLAKAQALCSLGQHAQGLAVARRWLTDQRDRSAQAARVKQMCRPKKN